MFAPRFFVSMVGALAAFAVTTYYLTGSLSATVVQTLICAVLIQVGYFLTILLMVWKEARRRRKPFPTKLTAAADAATEEKQKIPYAG
ncbi:exopolysaccharide production repressor protein [Sinorhizobium kostiense]|uniref:Exopolysaccharide production repressor protein n=1 Tax=Sinorhizobium kostiense TaxID=76747 RepID=A0ABS4QSC1_9HYPH|nr:exopolysaccharide production repressor protein [Sinorhizobium kostiense]